MTSQDSASQPLKYIQICENTDFWASPPRFVFRKSGVVPESYRSKQRPGSAEAPGSGAYAWRSSTLDIHYPHMAIWHSVMFSTHRCLGNISQSSNVFLQHHVERLCGMACYRSAILEFQRFLMWGLQAPKGSMDRSVPFVIQLFYFLLLKYFSEKDAT